MIMSVFELSTVRYKKSTGAPCLWVGQKFRCHADKQIHSCTQSCVNIHAEIQAAKHTWNLSCTRKHTTRQVSKYVKYLQPQLSIHLQKQTRTHAQTQTQAYKYPSSHYLSEGLPEKEYETFVISVKDKGKAIPSQAWTGHEGSRRLRLRGFN